MKRLSILLLLAVNLFIVPVGVFAQGIIGSDGHTAREEAEGKEIWEKLQTKQLECKNLTDDNYGSLGEYGMGQMVGTSHEAINTMMERMMGKVGEEQMHIVMGKRLSGCRGVSFLPMMWMMGGGENPMMGYGGWNSMMGGWSGFGLFGWLSMIFFWGLFILGVIALIRYVSGSTRGSDKGKSPLDILKERYAKGELDKKEFNEMKKDLI